MHHNSQQTKAVNTAKQVAEGPAALAGSSTAQEAAEEPTEAVSTAEEFFVQIILIQRISKVTAKQRSKCDQTYQGTEEVPTCSKSPRN